MSARHSQAGDIKVDCEAVPLLVEPAPAMNISILSAWNWLLIYSKARDDVFPVELPNPFVALLR